MKDLALLFQKSPVSSVAKQEQSPFSVQFVVCNVRENVVARATLARTGSVETLVEKRERELKD